MKSKIALLIIYNHRFDRNIPVLENLLKKKWSNIFHIVPFYDGDKGNVITVYENSYYYEGYLAQAYQTLRKYEFDHFVIIGDDMVLAPNLNENNILEELGVGEGESYFPVIKDIQSGKWDNISYAASYRLVQKGAEVVRVLPPVDEARELFEEKGFPSKPRISTWTALKNLLGCHIVDVRSFVNYLMKILRNPFGNIEFEYPFVSGISDFFIIDAKSMPRFCQYCGAFAATNLFIEVAVPTSMILTCKTLKTQTPESKYKEMYIWGDSINKFAEDYGYNYSNLIENFPKDTLFVHPVKLSKWKQ